MMSEEEQFEKIEKYLSEELSGEEQKKMEQLIAQDSTLKKEVSLHKDLASFLSDTKGIELEAQLSTIGEEYAEKYKQNPKLLTLETVQKSRRWISWMAAASLLFVLTLGWWYNQSGVNTQQLFAAHYEVYISDELERSNSTVLLSPLETGLNAYNKEAYKVAITVLEQAYQVAETPRNNHTTILFHLAMSHLELKSYAAAAAYLNQIVNFKKGSYTQQAYWYLALINLREGNISDSKIALQQLLEISTKGKYAQQAQELLKEIN